MTFPTRLLRHLELIFTVLGLVVIFGMASLLEIQGVSHWVVAAITATLVGVIHGILFWAVRHRQRLSRRLVLAETERMLRDIVVNQLAVIRMDLDLQMRDPTARSQVALSRVEQAIEIINTALHDLNEESLARWRSRYDISKPPFAP